MNRRVIILVIFVVVLVWGYGTYTFDKRLDTLEKTIEQTAQEVKERPKDGKSIPPTWIKPTSTSQPPPTTWSSDMPIPPQFRVTPQPTRIPWRAPY